MRSCSASASPVLRQPGGCCASLEFSFSSLQKCVNHLLASDAEGLFLVHAEEEDVAVAEHWLATESTQYCTKASPPCPYAIADVALLHLKQLNGSLLTSYLYPYFMIVAENSNIDTQLYVLRMLIDRLPSAHYTLLKDMSLLWFKQSTFGNNWVHILKLGSLLGPLFVNKKDHFPVPCRYYLEIMLIPRVDKKIRVLNFKSQCNHLIQQIKQDLLLLQSACAELRGSEKFVKLLEAVLVIGNYLNGDSSRGHAKGFKLDALLKLMDVKGSNRQTTLLHFVVVELAKVDEQFLTLPDELNGIKTASSLKLENIIASINDLDRGLEITRQEIEFAKADLSDVSALRSKFLELLLPFYENCSAQVFELKELLNSSLSKLKDISEYFGESGDEQPPRQMDLFRTMHQFLSMFDHVSKEILEKRAYHKAEQRNDKAHFSSKIRKCEDKKAAASLPSIVKERDDNKAKASVRENSPHLNKCIDRAALQNSPTVGNDGDKENQQPMACVEEVDAAKVAMTKPLLAQLPLKANSHNAPHSLGYDSDWSTG